MVVLILSVLQFQYAKITNSFVFVCIFMFPMAGHSLFTPLAVIMNIRVRTNKVLSVTVEFPTFI